MTDPAAKVTVCGQILALQQADSGKWFWTGDYVTLPPVKTAGANSVHHEYTRKLMTVTLPGYLIHPFNPNIVDSSSFHDCHNNHAGSIYSDSQIPAVTWSFNGDALDVLTNGIWEGHIQSGRQGETLDKQIPKFAATDMLPYKQLDGMMQRSISSIILTYLHVTGQCSFVATNAIQNTSTQPSNDDELSCYQCAARVKRNRNQLHVGSHVLRWIRKVPDAGLREQVSKYDNDAL